MSRLNKILLVLLIILAILTAIAWFFPDAFAQLTALNPFGREGTTETSANLPSTQQGQTTPRAVNNTDSLEIAEDGNESNEEEAVEELTSFEKEVKIRHESYQTKVFTYEPYEMPVARDPFQRMVSTVYLEDEEESVAKELNSEEAVRRFVQPELPPDSKFTGLISAGDERLAILQIDNETYIVKQGDIIFDKFLVKSILDDKVVIDINGYEISLKLGGGEASDD